MAQGKKARPAQRVKQSPAQSAAQRPAASRRGGQAPTTLITVALALALTLVGLAGYVTATFLRDAIAPRSASVDANVASLSAFVCARLERQDYAALIPYIDPTPVPPSVTDAFDASAIIDTLRASDTRDGLVTSCAYAPYAPGSVVSIPGVAYEQLTLRRANLLAPITASLTLTQATGAQGGGWLIARDSGFLLELTTPTATATVPALPTATVTPTAKATVPAKATPTG